MDVIREGMLEVENSGCKCLVNEEAEAYCNKATEMALPTKADQAIHDRILFCLTSLSQLTLRQLSFIRPKSDSTAWLGQTPEMYGYGLTSPSEEYSGTRETTRYNQVGASHSGLLVIV